jgi:hypothetical protein
LTIGITPNVTKNAAGTFGVQWDGLIQGSEWPSPNHIYNLAAGWVASTETDPMYAGLAISEAIPQQPGSPPITPAVELGGALIRATNNTGGGAAGSITGFVVWTQDYAMINSPQSEVPLADLGMQVNFYRLGSGAKIVVAADPALVSLYGAIITSQVDWDFANQRIVAHGAGVALACRILRIQPAGCMTVNYNSTSKTAQWNRNGSCAVISI